MKLLFDQNLSPKLVAFWGFPPKVIWIRRGNCSTNDIKKLLNSNSEKIKAFILDSTNGILTLN
ncbi:DUF5615 family PIN-like protein [Tangfeifania diversioriginum]|uniref:DUF5615 family PIN-like protein n=1 Tax=Tangfeifania diversioriginum TaxID=1168035 RepID=UPI000933269D